MTKIQVLLPPYKVVFIEQYRKYVWDQTQRWHKALGINRTPSFNRIKLVNEYQPREHNPYQQRYIVELGPLPGEQT